MANIMNNAAQQSESASEGYAPDPRGIQAVLPTQDSLMKQLMGYATNISTTASNDVAPDENGVTDYAAKTGNQLAEFLDFATGIAEKSKGGIEEDTGGLASIVSTQQKPNNMVNSLLDWANDVTTISSAGEVPNPKGISQYAPEVIKQVIVPVIERITWLSWFDSKLLTIDTVYMIYGWPYYAVNDFLNNWTLYHDYSQNQQFSLTFLDAVNAAINAITDPASAVLALADPTTFDVIPFLVGNVYLASYYIFQGVYYGLTGIVLVPVYYILLVAAHLMIVGGAVAAVALFVFGGAALVAGTTAVFFAPGIIILGPFGVSISIVAAALAFTVTAFVVALPVFTSILTLYIFKWCWIALRDWILIPIFVPVDQGQVQNQASGNTGSFTTDTDAAAVVDAVNCEYEPDDPSCQQSSTQPSSNPFVVPSNPTRPTVPVAPQPSPSRPAEVEVDQFGNEITDEYELIDVNAGNPGLFYQIEDFMSNLDFDPIHLFNQIFPNGIHIGQFAIDM